MGSRYTATPKTVVIETKYYDRVNSIDCTTMVQEIGGGHLFDWEFLLNGSVPIEFSAVPCNINSVYQKLSLKAMDFPEDLGNTFREYLAKQKQERHYTVPVWVDRLNEIEVRVNVKRVLTLLRHNAEVENVTIVAEDRLLRAIQDEEEVTMKAYLRPYRMATDDAGEKMGIYLDLLEFKIL